MTQSTNPHAKTQKTLTPEGYGVSSTTLQDYSGNEAHVSVFGDLITSPRHTVIAHKFGFGVPTTHFRSATTGTGSLTAVNSTLIMSAPAGSTAAMETRDSVAYTPGQEIYCYFTAGFSNLTPTSVGHIGPGSSLVASSFGFTLGYENGEFDFRLTSAGVVKIKIPRSQWYDKLDGTGASGFVWKPECLNIFYIRFGYLGVSPATLSISTASGMVVVAVIDVRNTQTEVNLSSAYLPIHAYVGDMTIISGSWAAGVLGMEHRDNPGAISGARDTFLSSFTPAANANLITIRKKSGFDFVNFAISLASVAVEGTKAKLVGIVENAVFSPPLVYVSAGVDSMMEYSLDTSSGTGGETEVSFGLAKSDRLIERFDDDEIRYNGTETISLMMQGSGASDTVATLRWWEFF